MFSNSPSFRRVLVAVVVVSLAAVLVVALPQGASTARATVSDGDVVLGDTPPATCTVGTDANCAGSTTMITTKTGDAFQASSKGDGVGVIGYSASSDGVYGTSGDGIGLDGFSATNFGLYALSNNATGGHIETASQYGAGLEVQISNSSNGRGSVEAGTTGYGPGVLANATSGPGIEGTSTSGTGVWGLAGGLKAIALKATGTTSLSGPTTLAGQSTFTGTTKFARSGKLVIAVNGSRVTKIGIALTVSSMVLATVQGNVAGIYVQGVTIVAGSSGSFTIHLNKPTRHAVTVGWFVVN
ncbi:MAG TPA: hypothetical protein VG815_03010 [Chloroflexota bacterium]|nr:hypothetical protein [Chloroflexota bacterium]